MQQLTASKITKFGCDGKDAQAAGLFFGFPQAPAADGLYHAQDLVALRSWLSESKKIVKVEALFQPGLAEAAARPDSGWCGKGLRLAGQGQ
jgi:hypothetical protein